MWCVLLGWRSEISQPQMIRGVHTFQFNFLFTLMLAYGITSHLDISTAKKGLSLHTPCINRVFGVTSPLLVGLLGSRWWSTYMLAWMIKGYTSRQPSHHFLHYWDNGVRIGLIEGAHSAVQSFKVVAHRATSIQLYGTAPLLYNMYSTARRLEFATILNLIMVCFNNEAFRATNGSDAYRRPT